MTRRMTSTMQKESSKALVDDAHMDEMALAKSKVLEKHL